MILQICLFFYTVIILTTLVGRKNIRGRERMTSSHITILKVEGQD